MLLGRSKQHCTNQLKQMKPICQTVLWPQDRSESNLSGPSTYPVLVELNLQGSRHGVWLPASSRMAFGHYHFLQRMTASMLVNMQ